MLYGSWHVDGEVDWMDGQDEGSREQRAWVWIVLKKGMGPGIGKGCTNVYERHRMST